MERKRNYIETVRDWADERLRRLCGRITPGKRLAVILVMSALFGGLSLYITVSSIYNIGKRDGQRLQIEHIRQLGRQPEKEKKPKRELSPKEVQRRRKMIVFPLMFLAFAGCMYLIFAPSGKEKAETESVGGFNADIPLPAEDGIIADKQTAYEQAMMSRKRQDRIQSLQDFGFIGDDETEEPQAEAGLMPEEDPKPVRGGGASSSATAYRDINRQLSTFYETPPEDREKEDLKRQVAELTDGTSAGSHAHR